MAAIVNKASFVEIGNRFVPNTNLFVARLQEKFRQHLIASVGATVFKRDLCKFMDSLLSPHNLNAYERTNCSLFDDRGIVASFWNLSKPGN